MPKLTKYINVCMYDTHNIETTHEAITYVNRTS